jgi:putative transposase
VLRFQVRVSWRTRHYYTLVRRALQGTLGRADFRIVHVSIQHTHVHLLVEAENRKALTRGMQSFAIRLARLVHRADEGRLGCGKVFAYRYHATQIRTARHARHALAYVLNNWRRHRVDRNERDTSKLDQFSSAISFDGWKQRRTWRPPADHVPLPVSPPRTSLLRGDWMIHGLIDVRETPGPLW